ncbi:uncharacterized protein LOC109821250 [Asparagus officinalis]|uniref:uncharacterized protein LOC109821250 n=1 Tax=Asparagus officinalis TaxID=4686 RepID=UPI00098E3CA9|nr:uncharacterized protein LOC109821250 [Asparagus officinalis]
MRPNRFISSDSVFKFVLPPLESVNDLTIHVPVNNASKSWVNLFADNRKPSTSLELNYVTPVDKDAVIFEDDEWNECASIWQFSLIGQVVGLNVKYKAMETFVHKVWAHLEILDVCLLWDGVYMFKFKNKKEMCGILENGPRFFGSRPLLLKPWTIDEEFDRYKDNTYPMWIQLPGLRLNLWNAKSISKIVSVIGRPITTNKLITNRQRLAYARVLVKVKMPSPLPDQISIQGPNGKIFS